MAKKTSKGKELKYARYAREGRYNANKKRNITKALKDNPDSVELKAALAGISWKRKAPKNREWRPEAKALAHTIRLVMGKSSKDLFSSNVELARNTMNEISKGVPKLPAVKTARFFCLEERARLTTWN
jgi:hypothetical protein